MTTFAKEICENRLHLSKKLAFCVQVALFLSDNLIRFSMIDQIIDYNKDFVARKGYEKYLTDKYPDKKLAVLSCMDTRLTELLPAALGLKNGDLVL